MALNRNSLYLLLIVACTAGYSWVFFDLTKDQKRTTTFDVCFIKKYTTLPCPSCGSTRAVLSILNGQFNEALNLNPIGYIIALILLLTPIWIAIDLSSKSNSLFTFYQKFESTLRKPKYALLFTFLILLNWLWNIKKGI